MTSGKNWLQKACAGCLLVGGAFLFNSNVALGDVTISGLALQLQADSESGSAAVEFGLESLEWDPETQSLSWELESSLDLLDPDTDEPIATLESAELRISECSRITLDFQLVAGDGDTTIVLRTGLLSFDRISSDVAEGHASASFTIRDLDGDGACLMGKGGGGAGVFRAYYNGLAPDGTRFAHLVGLVMTGAGGTATGSQSDPGAGYRSIGAAVDDMSVEIAFVVSAHDRVSGGTLFDVDPDPDGCADDADGDGVPDWLDECPDDADKTAPGECGCGVADADEDDDGVADCVDNCPESFNPDQADADGDGIGDACDPVGNLVADEVASESAGQTDDQGESPGDDGDGDTPGSESSGEGGDSQGQESDDAEGDPVNQQIEELLSSGVADSCGVGAAAALPLTVLTLGGRKLGARRRTSKR